LKIKIEKRKKEERLKEIEILLQDPQRTKPFLEEKEFLSQKEIEEKITSIDNQLKEIEANLAEKEKEISLLKTELEKEKGKKEEVVEIPLPPSSFLQKIKKPQEEFPEKEKATTEIKTPTPKEPFEKKKVKLGEILSVIFRIILVFLIVAVIIFVILKTK
jgi:septal ring factor EnvC (AmiA/AmiB activator)